MAVAKMTGGGAEHIQSFVDQLLSSLIKVFWNGRQSI